MNDAIPRRNADRGRSCWPGADDLHQSRQWTGPDCWRYQINPKILCCRPYTVLRTGERWFGSWQSTMDINVQTEIWGQSVTDERQQIMVLFNLVSYNVCILQIYHEFVIPSSTWLPLVDYTDPSGVFKSVFLVSPITPSCWYNGGGSTTSILNMYFLMLRGRAFNW